MDEDTEYEDDGPDDEPEPDWDDEMPTHVSIRLIIKK